MADRDDFSPVTIRSLQHRAAFICSNPECRCLTIAPSEHNEMEWIYAGIGAHITAAAFGGPRYDSSLTPAERHDVSNGIFLCSFCATVIDKNQGRDFSAELLRDWKQTHETWVRQHLNKVPAFMTELAGTHEACGIGDIAGVRISKPVKILPGTIVRAKGIGRVTGTSIE